MHFYAYIRTMLSGLAAKNLPTKQETWVLSLGQENPLEKEMCTWDSPGKNTGVGCHSLF